MEALVIAFLFGFILAWWVRPKWMVWRLKSYSVMKRGD